MTTTSTPLKKGAGTVTIRPMQFTDIPAVADISSRAFYNDEFYSMLTPYRESCPLAYRYWCLTRLRRRFVQRNTWGFVAVLTADNGKEVIVGNTLWSYAAECAGGTALDSNGQPKPDVSDPPVQGNNGGLWFVLERARCHLEGWYNEHPLSPYHNQCTDKTPLSTLLPTWLQPAKKEGNGIGIGSSSTAANAEFLKSGPAPPFAPLPIHFHCNGLAVSPDYQGKGIGKALMLHALATLVEPHRVPATLIASPTGYHLYKAIGFKTVGWLSPPGMFKGGMAMIWDEAGGRKWVKPANGAVVWEREVDAVFIDGGEEERVEMEVPETKEDVAEIMVEVAV